MADTITCNVYSRFINNDKRWIPYPISKESPQLGVKLTINEILELLTHSEVWVCDSSTNGNINTNNLNNYFPDFIPPYNRGSGSGGGGEGGGGGSITVFDNFTSLGDPYISGFVTSDWIVRDLPVRLVEYIKNSGNYDQVILTDILPRYTDKIVIDMQFGAATGLSNNLPFFGVVGTDFAYYAAIWADATNVWNSMSVYNHFNYTSDKSSNVISVSDTIKYQGNNPRQVFTLSDSTATWGNRSINFSDQINPYFSEVESPIVFFGLEKLGTITKFSEFELMLYSVKLYDTNNVQLCDLRPAERKSDYELGLYDMINDKFYSNSGNGTFEKGAYIL